MHTYLFRITTSGLHMHFAQVCLLKPLLTNLIIMSQINPIFPKCLTKFETTQLSECDYLLFKVCTEMLESDSEDDEDD